MSFFRNLVPALALCLALARCAAPELARAQDSDASMLPVDSAPTSTDNLYVEQGTSCTTGGTPSSVPPCNPLHIALGGLQSFVLSGLAFSELSGTVTSGQGGSGVASPTAHDLLIGEGSSAFASVGLASGQLLVGQASGDPAAETIGGDATLSAGGSLTVTKTSGTTFGTFATQNYAAPPAIGGVTPAAGAFTTLSATGKTTLAASTTAGSSLVLPTGVAPTSPVQGGIWNVSDSLAYEASGGAEYFLLSNVALTANAIPFVNAGGTSVGFSTSGYTAFGWNATNAVLAAGEISIGSWTGVLPNDAVICSTSVSCTTANYAMAITTSDAVNLNAATGQTISLNVNNSTIESVASTGVTINKLTLSAATPTVSSGQIGLGDSTAASSSCGSLSGAAGCLTINVGGTPHYLPYY